MMKIKILESGFIHELNSKKKRKNIFLSIVAGILLSFLYVTIFSLSDQDADTSGSLSLEVTEMCVETITELAGQEVSDARIHELAVFYEHPVRKLAHFSEYALMGVLVFVLLTQWMERSRKRFLFNIGWVFVSAVFDEIHQLFVNGRDGSPIDVGIDTAGGLFGICCMLLLLHMYRVIVARKKR